MSLRYFFRISTQNSFRKLSKNGISSEITSEFLLGCPLKKIFLKKSEVSSGIRPYFSLATQKFFLLKTNVRITPGILAQLLSVIIARISPDVPAEIHTKILSGIPVVPVVFSQKFFQHFLCSQKI